jgi:hypothetical protein
MNGAKLFAPLNSKNNNFAPVSKKKFWKSTPFLQIGP